MLVVILITVAHFLRVLTERNENQQKYRKNVKSLFRESLLNEKHILFVIARKSSKLYKKIRFALRWHQVYLPR